MQRSVIWVLGALILLYAAFQVLQKLPDPRARNRSRYGARRFLGAQHQAMYWRLVQTFSPAGFIVLAQVGLGAVLVALDGADRRLLGQRADFVLLSGNLKVLAVIEVSETAEEGVVGQSVFRDAGYRHLRYRGLPSVEVLKADLFGDEADAGLSMHMPNRA